MQCKKKQIVNSKNLSLLETKLRKIIREELLVEDSPKALIGFAKLVDGLTKNPPVFLKELAKFIDKCGFLQLNSPMASLYKDPYLKQNLDFSAWMASKYNFDPVFCRKYMKVVEFISKVDNTIFGNNSEYGIFDALKTMYEKDGNVTKSSYDGSFK